MSPHSCIPSPQLWLGSICPDFRALTLCPGLTSLQICLSRSVLLWGLSEAFHTDNPIICEKGVFTFSFWLCMAVMAVLGIQECVEQQLLHLILMLGQKRNALTEGDASSLLEWP